MAEQTPKILLCIPSYNGEVNHNTMAAILNCVHINGVAYTVMASSFLTFNFNRFWCMALNDPNIKYFVMLHADIAPIQNDWLTRIINLAEQNDADIMSAVSPIKMDTGHTSTALSRIGEPFGKQRRLMMQETHDLPKTFNRYDLAKLFKVPGREHQLLVNTGLMCVRMKKREQLEQMYFDVHNWIRKNEQGQFYAVSEPEDWDFSEQAQRLGLNVYATTEVEIAHMNNNIPFVNNAKWGTLQHDPGDLTPTIGTNQENDHATQAGQE